MGGFGRANIRDRGARQSRIKSVFTYLVSVN